MLSQPLEGVGRTPSCVESKASLVEPVARFLLQVGGAMSKTRLLCLSVLMLVESLALSARAGGPNKRMAQEAVDAYVAAGMTGTQQIGRFTVQPVPHTMNGLRAVTPPQPEGQPLLPRGDYKVAYVFVPGGPSQKVVYANTTVFRKNTRSGFAPWGISHMKEATVANPENFMRMRWQPRGRDGRFGKHQDDQTQLRVGPRRR